MSESEERDQPFLSLQEGITQLVAGLTQAFSELAAQVMPVAQGIYDAAWQGYRDAGMPYGESHDGLMRWMEDLRSIREHERSIERIKHRQDTLICARKLGEAIRAKREQEEASDE